MIQSYPWYIADWRNSETRLSLNLAERGLYRELLDYCYMEGNLPADRELLVSIAGANGKQTRYCLEAVMKLFVLKDGPNGSRYHHPKVDEVREKLFCYHEQKKHAGIKSGQARRERTFNGRSTEKRTDAEPSPSPAPAPYKTEEKALATSVAEFEFDEFWKEYWNRAAKKPAQAAFARASRKYGGRFLIDSAKEDRNKWESRPEWEYRSKLHAATWLNQARWGDELPPEVAHKNGKQSQTSMLKELLGDYDA